MKVVLNRDFGGFSLSKEAAEFLGLEWDGYGFFKYIDYDNGHFHRDDPDLVQCVQKLGKKANGSFAFLTVITIPDNIDWYIDEYDGVECVRERGHCWPEEDML